MYQHKLYVIPYTEENISRTIKSFAENHEREKKKINASLQTDKRHLGITAAILSRCFGVISLNITNIISVTLTIPCIWPCHCQAVHAIGTNSKMALSGNKKSVSETQAGKAQ